MGTIVGLTFPEEPAEKPAEASQGQVPEPETEEQAEKPARKQRKRAAAKAAEAE